VNLTQELGARLRGLVSSNLARVFNNGAYDLDRTVVISGFPRSGTTWLAQVISSLPGCGLVFEPLNTDRVRGARVAGFGWDNFRLADDEWAEGERFMSDVLAGKTLNSWTASRLPLLRSTNVNRWIVKFVRANPLLPWLVRHFPRSKPVLVLRHPCAVYSSWIQRHWPVAGYAPPKKARFFAAFPEYLETREKLSTPEEFFAAAWCIEHCAIFRQMNAGELVMCYYEDLVLDAERELDQICRILDIPINKDLSGIIKRPSSKASNTLQAGSVNQLTAWRERLPSDVGKRIVGVLKAFDLHCYDLSPLPNRTWPWQ